MPHHLDVVRHELGSRIAALDVRARDARASELAAAVDEIRVIANAAGLAPAVTVIHFIAAAIARGERGPGVHGWLQVLNDAVETERQDVGACESFAALCSVRLAA